MKGYYNIMKLRIQSNHMEEVEGLYNEYPYVLHQVDMSRTAVPWHWHEALEFCYLQKGSIKVSTAGQTQTFQKGEGFFINSNVLTAMTEAEDCVLDSHLFHPVFLGGHFKSVYETKYLNPVIQNRNLDILPIRGQTGTQRQLLQKLRQLSLLQNQPDVEFQTRNLVSEIWLLLLEELRNTQLKASPAKNQDRILTMLAYIQENYEKKLTLQDIADAGAVSTRECLRCFRASIRQSPVEYLMEYRLQAAAKLLETTNLPVAQIAMRTGWGSSSYFAKMFHELRGKTPNAYRKEYLALQKQAVSPNTITP